MKKFIVVAYDIEDDRRRRKAAEILEGFGTRVNRSVFECFVSDGQFEKLKAALAQQVRRPDSVLYYVLCRACIERIDRHGAAGIPAAPVRSV